MTETMNAIYCRGYGGPEVMAWVECPMPEAQVGEVLIKVAAAGLNRADLLQREGKYPPPEGASPVMGLEVSGEIVSLGVGVKRWKIGDRVCALLAGGGYAEYVAVNAAHCLPLLDHLSLIEGASLIEAMATVWSNVFEIGALKEGETILVHGGSSGIGITAIQLAKLLGAKIFVTVGSDEKCMACLSLGADMAINYHDENFVDAVMERTARHGVNVVLDMIGGDYVDRNLACLAPFGRHVSIATQKGKNVSIDMRHIMAKRLTLTGSTLRGRDAGEKARLLREVEEKVWPFVSEKRFKPLIYQALPIKNVAQAHKMMESSQHIGKIVLEVAG